MRHSGRFGLRLALLAGALAGLAGTASAYYHFSHYTSRTSPYNAIAEKFELSALPNHTLYYFVSDAGPTQYAAGDSYAALLSHIRFAARAWNAVDTSDLRLAFGGLFSSDTRQSTPHMEILFEDVPGVLAVGSVTAVNIPITSSTAYVPVAYSTVKLARTMTGPSYGSLSMTIVHEMGHALGLQHTLTSSTMSTMVTRATTLARPLAADDVAAISLLYPNSKLAQQTGSISGRVTLSGNGVHMASVVALSPTGDAVSALANPDGTYRIDGVPPGECYVYVHTLPPTTQGELGPSEIVLPKDPDGNPVQPGASFQTQFYPGASDWRQASRVSVGAGTEVTGIDFSVNGRGGPQIYGVTTYSYPGSFAVEPAFVNTTVKKLWYVVAQGQGLLPNGRPAPGLNVSVLGDVVNVDRSYPYYQYVGQTYFDYYQTNFQFTPFSAGSGLAPRHLVYAAGDEVYVLPSGLNLVDRQPPTIDSVNQEFDGSGNRFVSLTGTGFTSSTRILFDGLPASIIAYDEAAGKIQVTPPPAAAGHRAALVALNPLNGQTSLLLQDTPPTYTYDSGEAPAISLSPSSLPIGAESVIDIMGVNTNFVDGLTALGFGSSDIVVTRLWVVSPTQLRANVRVSAGASATSSLVSVVTGFQVVSQPFAFQTVSDSSRRIIVTSNVVEASTGGSLIYPGVLARVAVSNAGSSPTVTLNDVVVPVTSATADQITFQIPSTFPTGVAFLRVQSGGNASYPVAITIDAAPPVITSLLGPSGNVIDASQGIYAGDQVTVLATGLDAPGATVAASRVKVTIGGVDHQPQSAVAPVDGQQGVHAIQVLVLPAVTPGAQTLTVTIDNRTSAPVSVAVKAR